MIPATFATPRLLLRPPEVADAEAIFQAYAQDPEVTRYLIWRPHPDVATTEAFLAQCVDGWARGSHLTWVIVPRAEERPVGMISLQLREFHAILGYVLARRLWGQGVMTEAVRVVVEAALAEPAIFRVWAVCDWENPGSARVLEKVGMEREGTMRRGALHPNVSPEPRDCLLYARVK
jgi:[ribosomal protein S5]-alanine N-acetyltransferase